MSDNITIHIEIEAKTEIRNASIGLVINNSSAVQTDMAFSLAQGFYLNC
jgi:hypothetical protein